MAPVSRVGDPGVWTLPGPGVWTLPGPGGLRPCRTLFLAPIAGSPYDGAVPASRFRFRKKEESAS
jgi:hypothetical protein